MNMKNILFGGAMAFSMIAMAGNEDRVGSAGASHLLVNPWARSAAFGDAGISSVNGLEATYINIAGLAFTDKTQIKFNYSNWMGSAGIAMNSAGIAQRISETDVIAVSVQSLNYGDIPITTVANPEGNIGFFSPRANIFNVGYARAFSQSIYGGINFKVISSSISNLKSSGVAIDAGIRYVTGEKDNMRFGITLRNVGPPMRYRGDGLSLDATVSTGSGNTTTLNMDQRSEKFELPSMVNVGFAYDFNFSERSKLTTNLQFTSNSFTRDQFGFGAEYAFNNRFILRGGYQYEANITSDEERTTAFTGPAGGFTVQVPAGKNGTILGLDYGYRATNPFGGVHSIGVHVDL